MLTETCTIKITMSDKLDHFHEEDIVKDMWPYITPWFTARRGVRNGRIILEDGTIIIDWKYETNEPPESEA
jgi:hypothetical protein